MSSSEPVAPSDFLMMSCLIAFASQTFGGQLGSPLGIVVFDNFPIFFLSWSPVRGVSP